MDEILFEKECKKTPSKRRFKSVEKNKKQLTVLQRRLANVLRPSKTLIKLEEQKPFLKRQKSFLRV
jgi:hypothetical protein